MSPAPLGDGTTLPAPVVYEPLPVARSRDLVGDTVGPPRAAKPGEPADASNHVNAALQELTTALNGAVGGLASVAGMRVFNAQTQAWELWPVYVSPTDPELAAIPPTGNYVWLQSPSGTVNL